jgi:hypothetical protein
MPENDKMNLAAEGWMDERGKISERIRMDIIKKH